MATRIGILTVSDTRSSGQEVDLSGPAMQESLSELGYGEFEVQIVPDEIPAIQTAILELCQTCAAVISTGGTGFSPRDVTPEATAPLLEKRADSILEMVRLRGLEFSKLSHLSRGVAGVRGNVLIVNLPGSPKAVRQGIEALGPLLPEILNALSGERCSHGA